MSMKARRLYLVLRIPAAIGLSIVSSCSTPTLAEVARRGQAANSGRDVKDDVTVIYHITDRDVLNSNDEVKRKLANRRNVKTLKVLNDVLADKTPNLQDLDAQGDMSPTTTTSAVAKSDQWQ